MTKSALDTTVEQLIADVDKLTTHLPKHYYPRTCLKIAMNHLTMARTWFKIAENYSDEDK